MTLIKYQPQNAAGNTTTIDTENLFIGTDGEVSIRDSGTGRLVELTDEQISVVRQHFGRRLNTAERAVKALA